MSSDGIFKRNFTPWFFGIYFRNAKHHQVMAVLGVSSQRAASGMCSHDSKAGAGVEEGTSVAHSLLFRRPAFYDHPDPPSSISAAHLKVSEYNQGGFPPALGHPPRTWGVTKILSLRVKGEGKGLCSGR